MFDILFLNNIIFYTLKEKLMPIISTRDVSLHKQVKTEATKREMPIYKIVEELTRIGLDLGLLDIDQKTLSKIQELLDQEK